MKMFYLSFFFAFYTSLLSQDIVINFELKKTASAVHENIKVTVQNTFNNKEYYGISNKEGIASISIPEGGDYTVKLENSHRKRKLTIPNRPGIKLKVGYKYSGDEENDWAKKYPPTKEQVVTWENKITTYPDTTYSKLKSEPSEYEERLTLFIVKLSNINDGPLVGENIYATALKYDKTFSSKTNSKGEAFILLPKGDEYSISFKYDLDYARVNAFLSVGKAREWLILKYLGTKEIEKRKREKLIRIKKEEERLAKEAAELKEYLKNSKKREEEARKERLLSYAREKKEKQLIGTVLNRNNWKNKLVLCDLTGSMDPYAAQLYSWYTLNYALNKDMQFVFFNDGDNKRDSDKKIGETGGVYYSSNLNIDALINLMTKVQTAGNGGDCAENNMEALIKGTNQAKNFTEIIMIVDNNAPVKDIELLTKFNKPVHIILCGATSWVEEDYLQIAYKTKGSIHTIESDLTSLWRTAEGKTVKIMGNEYILMKGKFIKIDRL